MIHLLDFLYKNYRNAYLMLLRSAGFQALANDQISKDNLVKSYKQLTDKEQKDLSGRLLRMRAKAKGTDILHVLNGSAQPIPDEDSNKFTQLFTPIVKQFEEDQRREAERKKQEREERLAQEKPERERREREELNRLNRALLIQSGLIQSGWDDDFPDIKPVKPNYSLSFDDYSKLLAKNGNEISTEALELYIETDSAFDLLKNKINQSILALNELKPKTIEKLVNKGVVDLSQAMIYFLDSDHHEYKWRDIEWLVPSLLESKQFESLSNILNKTTDNGWYRCLNLDFKTITPFVSFLKGRRLSNDDFINICHREEILKWMIENEADFQRRQAIIKFFFEKAGSDVSMELFTYLFDHNYFYKFIWTCFGRCLNINFTYNEIQNMITHESETKAWEIAKGILRNHLNQQ